MIRINPFVEAYVYQSNGDVLIYVDGISQGVTPISKFTTDFANDKIDESIKNKLSEMYNTPNVYVIMYQ